MTIKEARKSAGLTQKRMSDLFEIPLRTIENWEGGKNKCPKWAEALIIEKLEMMDTSKELTEESLNEFITEVLNNHKSYPYAIAYLDDVFDGYVNIRVAIKEDHIRIYGLLLDFVARNNGVIISTQPATYTTIIRVKE